MDFSLRSPWGTFIRLRRRRDLWSPSFIVQNFPMNTDQIGLIVGAVLTGSLLGTLFTGSLADRYGRRTMIRAACWIFLVGLALILRAKVSFLF